LLIAAYLHYIFPKIYGLEEFARHWLSAGHLLQQPSECAGAGQVLRPVLATILVIVGVRMLRA
jgi:hypothetical protein